MAKRYQALLDERATLVAASRDIVEAVDAEAEARDLTDDERKTIDANAARLKVIAADLEREEDRRRWERTVEATPVALPAGPRISGMHLRPEDEPWGSKSGADFGEFLQAVHRSATGQGTDPRLLAYKAAAQYQAAAQGAGVAVGSDGGFQIGATISNRILQRVMTGQILSRLSAIPLDAGTNAIEVNYLEDRSRVTGSRFGGITGYWVDEGTAITASRPRFERRRLELRGVAALGYATNQLLRNASAMQAIFERGFTEELRWQAENATIRGTGAGQPQGILTGAATVSVAAETGQSATTILKENIDKMWARMLAAYRAGAVWLINQDIEPELDNLSMVIGTGGVPVYLPPGGLSDTPFARLKGRPVIPVEYCSTLGTVGDIILANWEAYLWIQETIQNDASLHVAFTTNETAFRAVWEVDGQPEMATALTPANGTNTLSSFVTLATRS